MSAKSNSPSTINYNGDTFTIPAWMQDKAGKEGLTRSELGQIVPIPKDEEPYAVTPVGNQVFTNSEPQQIQEGQQIGSVARFTAADHLKQINVRRFTLPQTCKVFGNGQQAGFTNVMLVVPQNYGYGVPLKESYVNPGLRCSHNGEWVEPPHYFDEAKKFTRTEGAREKNWRYMCIEFTSWKPENSFFTYLDALFLFLSDPWKYPHQH